MTATPKHPIQLLRSFLFPGSKRTRRGVSPDRKDHRLAHADMANPDPQARNLLSIPVLEQTDEDVACAHLRLRGMFLARQDEWEELADEMRAAERDRRMTEGGRSVTELLSFGARSDVVHAVEHALDEGSSPDAPILLEGVMGFERILKDSGNDPMIAQVVAQTHVDIGWAWHCAGTGAEIPQVNRRRCWAHFDRAAAILEPLCARTLDSPALMAAQCALYSGRKVDRLKLADDYEKLIDMAPKDPSHMRALGTHLLPRWKGSYQALELEARRTAARTQDTWGNGGYSWVMINAIAQDPEACRRVDTEFFLDGLLDIVARAPGQSMVNYLAAYCAVGLPRNAADGEEPDGPRARISAAADWLIRDHMTELHAMTWAHAADGFNNTARVDSSSRFAHRGREKAIEVISGLFQDEIQQGLRVVFTPDGLQILGN